MGHHAKIGGPRLFEEMGDECGRWSNSPRFSAGGSHGGAGLALGTAPDAAVIRPGRPPAPDFERSIRRGRGGGVAQADDALGKVDLATARLYSSLVEDAKLRERVFDLFEAEFHRTVRSILAITRQKELLETNQVLAHSIKLRNPYVDPMHLIQVDMLRRKRAGEKTPEVDRAIAATISGISAGLRNTG